MTNLFTIGYEGMTVPAFLAELEAAGVRILVDVREFPGSRRRGFSKSKLAKALEQRGIAYMHKRELGAPKAIRHELRDTRDLETYFRRFNAYIRTQRRALEQLVAECAGAVVLMCYERDPAECHRSVVARELAHITRVEPVHLGVEERIGSLRKAHGLRPRQGVSAA